ncbi:MAG: TrkA family potassium uptake protein [Christensenella sp.]|nr:TrkA family potassium uptake protein [Christensenella sp.]
MKVIIIGGGQTGAYIANILLSNKCEVTVIENREPVYIKLKREIPEKNILFGNGTDPNILEQAGIDKADVLAAVTGADETNLVAATIARFEFDVPRVIARVNNPKNAWLFNAGMGVDVAINQADLLAHLVVEEMNQVAMLTLMKISRGTYSIVQFKVSETAAAAGKPIREISLPEQAVLIAVYQGEKTLIPHGDTMIGVGDVVLAFADESSQQKLNALFK